MKYLGMKCHEAWDLLENTLVQEKQLKQIFVTINDCRIWAMSQSEFIMVSSLLSCTFGNFHNKIF